MLNWNFRQHVSDKPNKAKCSNTFVEVKSLYLVKHFLTTIMYNYWHVPTFCVYKNWWKAACSVSFYFHYNYSFLDKQEEWDKPEFNAVTKIKLGTDIVGRTVFMWFVAGKLFAYSYCLDYTFWLHLNIKRIVLCNNNDNVSKSDGNSSNILYSFIIRTATKFLFILKGQYSD